MQGYGCDHIFVSPMTLALAEDLGWYKANYTRASKLSYDVHWGYKRGCDFMDKPCVHGSSGSEVASSPEFCTENDKVKISPLGHTHVKCVLGNSLTTTDWSEGAPTSWTALGEDNVYFQSDKTKGGNLR